MRTTTIKPSREMIAQASAWLIEFRTEEPTQEQRDQFSAWLCISPQHIQAYLEVAGAWSELPDEDPEGRIDIQKMIGTARATPANVVSLRVQGEPLFQGSGDARSARSRLHRLPLALAATLVMAVFVATGSYLYIQRDTYTTGTGERRSLTLADGSSVELNSQSEIRIRYTDKARQIELIQGQALFHVAKDQAHPFIVATGDTQVRAVGTQFDVYRKPSGTIVTVVEGSVSVMSAVIAAEAGTQWDQPREAPPILLAAGQQLTVPLPTADPVTLESPRAADIEAATAWTRKRLVFEDTPLSEVAEEFNRYNIRPLVIADPELRHIGVSGLYSSADPSALIAFLSAQPGILVTEADTEIRVTRKSD
jgi:transmembrane sensor